MVNDTNNLLSGSLFYSFSGRSSMLCTFRYDNKGGSSGGVKDLNGLMIILEVAGHLQGTKEFMRQKMKNNYSYILVD